MLQDKLKKYRRSLFNIGLYLILTFVVLIRTSFLGFGLIDAEASNEVPFLNMIFGKDHNYNLQMRAQINQVVPTLEMIACFP